MLTTLYDSTGNDYTPVQLKDVKRGEFVTRKPSTKTVFIRGDYDQSSKTYSLGYADDHGRELFLKGSTIVYIGFTY